MSQSQIETGIPSDLALYNTLKYDGVISRVNSYQPASPQSNYQAGQLITFQMPLEFLDFRNMSWQFTIQGSVTGGTFARFNSDIRSIIKRMTIVFGSKVVYDCQHQNLLFNITNQIKDVNWAAGPGTILNGTGSTTQRNADFTNPNRVYAVQLYNQRAELLSSALPLQKLNMQMYINLYLAPANECVETDGTNPNYIVNNNQLHISSLIPSSGWEQRFASRIPQGISFNYLNFENAFDTSILGVGVSRASKTLNFRYTSLTGIIFVMRPSAGLQNPATLNKLSEYDFNNLNSCSIRLGSFQQPTDQDTNYADRYTMAVELFGKSTQLPLALAQNFNTTNFVGAVNLAKHPFEEMNSSNSVNGVNTSISSALILDMSFSSPLSQNYTLDVYAMSECSVIWQPNGSIIWEN